MSHQTPYERAEAVFEEIVVSYHEGDDREIRAAVKLLMVALVHLQEHDSWGWQGLVEQYCLMLKNDPAKFSRMLEANRGLSKTGTELA